MTARAAAARYARALFDVLLAEGADLNRAGEELSAFARVLSTHETLHRALTNPAVPTPAKRGVVQDLLDRSGDLLPPVAKLLLMLAERDRLGILHLLVEQYDNRLLEHLRVVRAEVVTAIPLSPDRAAAFQAALTGATGRDVRLDARVDHSIVGGAVTRIGSTVYDGSVTRQLQRMRDALVRQG